MAKQPILAELELFINGATAVCSINAPGLAHLAHCGLNLLQNLPASKEAVFEYFTIFFDASVAGYVQLIEKDLNAIVPYDNTIEEVQDALETLINDGQHAWSPLIASWSLKALGVLSKKYNWCENKDIASTCNLWLGSSAMRCLLGLTVSCFEKLDAHEEETFVDCMLKTYMKNSPNFDWVVARLGSCFPQKIILKILKCGLKNFAGNGAFVLDSEIGILSYLSFVQDVQLKIVLSEMIKSSLYDNSTHNQADLNTIPYLLTLSGKSDVILQQMVSVFLNLYDDAFIPALRNQIKLWPSNFGASEIMPSLTTLALRLRKGATTILLSVAEIAEDYVWCHDLLEFILQEIFNLVSDDRTCPILSDILDQNSQDLLIKSSISGSLIKRQTAIRLILLAAGQSAHIYHHSIAELLACTSSTDNTSGIEALIRLVSNLNGLFETVRLAPGIALALERLLIDEIKMENDNVRRNLNVLQNLLILIRMEKQGGSQHLKESPITSTMTKCHPTLIEIAKRYLSKAMDCVAMVNASDIQSTVDSDEPMEKKIKLIESQLNKNEKCFKYSSIYKEHIHTVVGLLDILEIGQKDDSMAMDDCIKLAELSVKYFFWSLIETDKTIRTIAVNRAYSLIARQCSWRKYSRVAVLRELLEGALFLYGNLFGVHNKIDFERNSYLKKRSEHLLIKLNQSQNNTPNNIRSSLHAGIIGQGLKVPPTEPSPPDSEFRNMLLHAITVCCKQDDAQKTIDGFTSVALLLVEFVSPDVMYNGLPWPDEEFSKITMERDLHIRRTFKNTPILWSILALIATYRPTLCFTSVLLRAICASLLHQWRAKSVLHNQTVENNYELYVVTKNLLEIMAMGQLLPGPFAYLHMVIEHFEPFEIALVLKDCIWNYLKENIPSPMQFSIASNGLHWRNPSSSKPHPQFVDPLRNIMQRKLSKLGTLYHYMFVLPELNKSS